MTPPSQAASPPHPVVTGGASFGGTEPASGLVPVYDSDVRRDAIAGLSINLWRYRGLVRLLVSRDLTVRYKRSVLGVWWTLLNPLLTMAIMWVVFSQLFRFQTDRVPYLTYLFAGLIFFNFFQQTVVAVGSSLTASSGVIAKVYVPAEAFAVSAALAGLVNFVIAFSIFCAVDMLAGPGLSWTVLLVPFPVVCLLALATGVGLVVATLAVRFYDALDLTAVLLGLIGYLTPTFYPEGIVPDRFRAVLRANPLYHYLRVFRALATDGSFPDLADVAVVVGTSLGALALGCLIFARSWRNIATML